MLNLFTLSCMMKFSLQLQNNLCKKDSDGCTQPPPPLLFLLSCLLIVISVTCLDIVCCNSCHSVKKNIFLTREPDHHQPVSSFSAVNKQKADVTHVCCRKWQLCKISSIWVSLSDNDSAGRRRHIHDKESQTPVLPDVR